MLYDSYHFAGMHLIWWFVWGMLVFWIFAIPYKIPGQRMRRETPLEILQRRFASGDMKNEEYEEKKKLLETEKNK